MTIWRGWGIVGLLPLLIAVFIFRMAWKFGFQHRGDGPQSNSIRDAGHSLFLVPLQFYALPLFAAGMFMAVATSLAPP